MEGRPGKTQVTVKVGNRSAKPISGMLAHARAGIVEGPHAGDSPCRTQAAGSAARRLPVRMECRLEARMRPHPSNWTSARTRRLRRSLIPSQYAIRRAKNIKIDGRLNDWGPETQLPAWMLGSTAGDANATVHLAWAKEGLYGAVAVRDSKVNVKDPKSFWAGDVLELFLDTADNKQPRAAVAGDHQFWFVPQPDANRVYLGQWKMKDEIPATRYEIPAIKGVAVRTADGYVMEFLLPADQIRNYRPEARRQARAEPQPDDPGQATQPRSLLARPKEPPARRRIRSGGAPWC